MVRQIVAEQALQGYLEKLGKYQTFNVGLIVGQPSANGKDQVLHMARTPDVMLIDEKVPSSSLGALDSIAKVDSALMANHALSMIRMLPASFFVMGIFVVSPTNLFDDDEAFRKAKAIIFEIKSILAENPFLQANSDHLDNGERLVLFYSSQSRGNFSCKSLETGGESSRHAVAKPTDWKFQETPCQWQLIESCYELDEVFPLIKHDGSVNIEDNFMSSLKSIDCQLKKSIVFFDGESPKSNGILETILKAKKQSNDDKPIQASIYLSCNVGKENEASKIVKHQGTVRYKGIISSRIWVHAQTTLEAITRFVQNDIVRSLAARIQIHCDSLVESVLKTDTTVLNEPPRRVYFTIKPSLVQLSDYLFRGELEETVLHQAKELLDVDLAKIDLSCDAESFAVASDETNELLGKKSDSRETTVDHSKLLYIIGIIVAALILLLSIILHFIIN